MHVAIFLPNWVGDVAMATPAIHALRQRYPGARFLAVLKPYVAGLLDGSPWFDGLIYADKCGGPRRGTLAVARRLLAEEIDLAVLFTNTFRSALAAWLGRCRRRIGYARRGRGWTLTDALAPIRDAAGVLTPSPIIDAYNRLAERAGATPDRHVRLATTPRQEAAAHQVWRRTGLDQHREVVCLNPGAAFGSSKHWSVPSFAELARRLVRARGCGVLVLCGPGERDMARQIVAGAGVPGVHSLADVPLSLGLTMACVRRADLLITTDSGPRHFAAAFGTPVVTLFGPTHIAWTETYYAKAIHLQKQVDCGPCQQRVCPLDHRCMTLLAPDEVFAAAQELLARHPPVGGRHAG
ncbi:MAG TPA: lipopolysaccharide heptosyltransferase II [Gemmataceae bacterium]|jgi:heptosyltransferase-2